MVISFSPFFWGGEVLLNWRFFGREKGLITHLMPGIPVERTFLDMASWRALNLWKISSPLAKLLPKQALEMTSPEKLLMCWSMLMLATPPVASTLLFQDFNKVSVDSFMRFIIPCRPANSDMLIKKKLMVVMVVLEDVD